MGHIIKMWDFCTLNDVLDYIIWSPNSVSMNVNSDGIIPSKGPVSKRKRIEVEFFCYCAFIILPILSNFGNFVSETTINWMFLLFYAIFTLVLSKIVTAIEEDAGIYLDYCHRGDIDDSHRYKCIRQIGIDCRAYD